MHKQGRDLIAHTVSAIGHLSLGSCDLQILIPNFANVSEFVRGEEIPPGEASLHHLPRTGFLSTANIML